MDYGGYDSLFSCAIEDQKAGFAPSDWQKNEVEKVGVRGRVENNSFIRTFSISVESIFSDCSSKTSLLLNYHTNMVSLAICYNIFNLRPSQSDSGE